MSIDRGMDKENVLHIYNGILWPQKEWNHAICSNMDGPGDDNTKWSQTEKDKYHDITYMWNQKKLFKLTSLIFGILKKKLFKWTYLQNRNRLTNMENKT